jgi:molybdenum cofactor guanylyltransferase
MNFRAGVVLCGGKSQRMGASKPSLPIAGEWMLPRVVRLMRDVVNTVVVVAAPKQDLPSLPCEVRVVRDEREGRGPLQGLAAGLAAIQDSADAAFVSSCDVPFLRPALVRRMFELLGPASVCVPQIDGHFHPLSAVYRVGIIEAVNSLLDANRLKVQELFELVPTRIVTSEELRDVDPMLESLRNVNTPEEYQQALAVFSSRS